MRVRHPTLGGTSRKGLAMLEKLPEFLGQALRGQRAGMANVVLRTLFARRQVEGFTVSSTAFLHMQPLPVPYTADGLGISPPLEWRGVPEGSGCVVLIVEDADSPTPHPLVHAITVSAGGDGGLNAGALPSVDHDGSGVVIGLNSYLQHRWLPPDPPPGHGSHRYAFQCFALRDRPAFSAGLGRHELVEAVLDRAVAAGCLVGLYERAQRQKMRDANAFEDTVPAEEAPATVA